MAIGFLTKVSPIVTLSTLSSAQSQRRTQALSVGHPRCGLNGKGGGTRSDQGQATGRSGKEWRVPGRAIQAQPRAGN